MKGQLCRYIVIFHSAAGTHFRRAWSKREALAIARTLRDEGHQPRVIQQSTGNQIYGTGRLTDKKAA